MTAQGGQVFRAPAGSWAIRFYDAAGQCRQRNGFRTRGEARTALNEQLRRVRLGPLHRPQVTLNKLADVFLAAWRKSLPAARRYPAHRALRQVSQAAVRWKWIEENAAAGVKNPQPPMGRDRSVRGLGGDRRDRG
jgi:hypothetical protein